MSIIRNIRIKIMMLAILVTFTLLWGGVSVFSLYSLNSLTDEIGLTNVQQINGDIINGASDSYYKVKLLMDEVVIAENNSERERKLLSDAAADVEFLKGGLAQFKVTDHANISNKSIDDIYNSSYQLFSEAIVPMLDVVRQNNHDVYAKLVAEKYNPLRVKFTTAINEYNQIIKNLKTEAQARISAWVYWCKVTLIVAMIVGLGVLVLTDRYLAIQMGHPLEKVKAHLQILSNGKLDVTIGEMGNNEVGQLIPFVNAMQHSWIKTVAEIRRSASEIYHGSSEIAAGNSDLSSRTEEQAAALSETAASMEQLGAVVKQNADNAQQASVLAKDASAAANNGGEVVHAVSTSMQNITHSSQKIADIINVIDGIAFQTNILALNAAVEAARAGEAGRGFAVVASEVRNLAQRSAQAAKEIKTLIDESVDNVKNGYEQVSLASKSMEDILKSVTNVTDIMGEIASASSEQSKGISQVGTAITQMDSVTQQNAALVEQSSATSSSLEEQAHHLNEIVAVFKLPGVAAAQTARREHKPAEKVAALANLSPVSRQGKSGDDWTSF
ncbi:methyl-accepting chemotaxis protein [Dickeya sp. CFBP 2040]|uniref:methyl-accepting chemotaxis protein n=1 Tax=Dickeya sp. CFBP 2040 TaxID=2718531 RepID=UPI001446FFBF|nr:methyl-accepting chemotaxis protein [Dickeya sp. CFBP 2040]NKI75384.1 methyl-accepting chemotaxis protein [Dickeya sp. CFBP 2040]